MRAISAALLLTGLLQVASAAAQVDVESGSDSLQTTDPGAPSEGGAAATPTGTLAPRSALWRSALVPGWGQLSMGHPFKAALFFGAGAGWMSAAVSDGAGVRDATTALERQDRAARRNTRVLYYVITATLAGIDAYVDAHLKDFDIDAGPYDGPVDAGARLTIHF